MHVMHAIMRKERRSSGGVRLVVSPDVKLVLSEVMINGKGERRK